MVYSAYRLNKKGDNIQSSHILPILNLSVVPYLVLTDVSWQVSQEAGKMLCYSHLFKNFPQFVVIHTVKGFSIVNETEVDVLLKFPCFFYDPIDVNLKIRYTV